MELTPEQRARLATMEGGTPLSIDDIAELMGLNRKEVIRRIITHRYPPSSAGGKPPVSDAAMECPLCREPHPLWIDGKFWCPYPECESHELDEDIMPA